MTELRRLVGADGILPMSAEAERLVSRWVGDGGDLADLAQTIARRVNRPNLDNTPGYVMAILRDLPPVVARPDVSRPAWCGRCVLPGRWVPDDYGLPSAVHCPECSTSADKRTDAQVVLGSSVGRSDVFSALGESWGRTTTVGASWGLTGTEG